ncbi:hypothetical protein ACFV6B_13280 [Streptomyces microflavus]|uniref:hypothetical protein n=1 Tax=Streptomyces microflavus TaxID=1919 RepID=UPI003659E6F9
MVIVVSYAVVFLVVASPIGVALWRCLTGRMPEQPEPYARHRRPDGREEEVVVAESIVRTAYTGLAPLYDTPTPPGPGPR